MTATTGIYLDHAATTPCRPEVIAALVPYLGEHFGNASGVYALSRASRTALDAARAGVAAVLHCHPGEIIFTGGGTESDNLALRGVATAAHRAGRGNHIVISAIEHHAILHAADELEAQGFAVTRVGVDRTGRVTPEAVAAALRPDTCLVSIMLANNEVGTINPIAAIAALAHARGIPVHTDAVQAPGALGLDVDALGVDLLSLSGHKFYGPKGVGVLYVRQGIAFVPQQQGGGQEGGRRAGTENIAGIVGLATALTLAESERPEVSVRLAALRERLAIGLTAAIPDLIINGHPVEHLPGTLHLNLPGVDGESLLYGLDARGIACSAASACSAGSTAASHVLTAIGIDTITSGASLRLTLGRTTTLDEIDHVIAVLPGFVAALRGTPALAG
ncbi:MAG TPA: cysteine desulfurase family protein [Thermomicrobiales bacterium]|jgi:cysteine desulfurase